MILLLPSQHRDGNEESISHGPHINQAQAGREGQGAREIYGAAHEDESASALNAAGQACFWKREAAFGRSL
jgi:hypothetical protein